ncbi:35494_t:CDS:2, partial [Gigaspora margarita]
IGEGDQAVLLCTIDHWIAAFRAGDEDVEDKPCSGCSCKATTLEVIAKVKELVSDNPHITTRGLSDLVGIFHERNSKEILEILKSGYQNIIIEDKI